MSSISNTVTTNDAPKSFEALHCLTVSHLTSLSLGRCGIILKIFGMSLYFIAVTPSIASSFLFCFQNIAPIQDKL
jgi:hypothetical protein